MSELETISTYAVPEFSLACDEYPHLQDRLADILQNGVTANMAYTSLGRIGLANLVSEAAPNVFDLVTKTKERLDNEEGVVVLQDTGINIVGDELAQLTSIAIGAVYGTPTLTDRRDSQVAWPVKFDANASGHITFSQTLGEAQYHTDTQYFAKPEEYFGLFCVRSDTLGQGTNSFLGAAAVKDALISEHGADALQALAAPYPFQVPTVFTRTGLSSEVEITWAPILTSDGLIRYRRDTIEAALNQPHISIGTEQLNAMSALESAMESLTPIQYHLNPGDAAMVHNRRILHARTSFTNPERLLYRVRMRANENR